MIKKFNQYKMQEVEQKEVKAGEAGGTCGCSCYYAGSGGSSAYDNGYANAKGGLWSTKGEIVEIWIPIAN